jgi:hypothetical protein
MKIEIPEQLIDVVKAGVKANREVPGSIALGGTICALFTHHRSSTDIDFVLQDLAQRFDEIREHLSEVPGWKEKMVRGPFTILGILDGIRIGYRQLRRTAPIETQTLETPVGPLVVPTIEELLRTKAFLCYDRNYTRDFVDFAELSCLLDTEKVVTVLSDLDERFKWEVQPTILVQVIKSLLVVEPRDLDDSFHGYAQLRFLEPKLKSWEDVAARCREIGKQLALRVTEDEE